MTLAFGLMLSLLGCEKQIKEVRVAPDSATDGTAAFTPAPTPAPPPAPAA